MGSGGWELGLGWSSGLCAAGRRRSRTRCESQLAEERRGPHGDNGVAASPCAFCCESVRRAAQRSVQGRVLILYGSCTIANAAAVTAAVGGDPAASAARRAFWRPRRAACPCEMGSLPRDPSRAAARALGRGVRLPEGRPQGHNAALESSKSSAGERAALHARSRARVSGSPRLSAENGVGARDKDVRSMDRAHWKRLSGCFQSAVTSVVVGGTSSCRKDTSPL